jgi:Spy/CpxP family protein refolding chaperone
MYEKNKFLIWSILALIILNIGSLGLLWYKEVTKPLQPPPPLEQRVNPEKFLENEMQLNKDQSEAFRELRRKHQEETGEIRRDIHRLSKDIVDELYKPKPDTARVTALSDEIGRKQAEFERALYNHFNNLKQICNPNQQEKLHKLLFELLDKTKLDRPPQPPENRPDRRPPPRQEDNPDRK